MTRVLLALLVSFPAPVKAYDFDTHPYDLSPDTLDAGAWEVGVLWGRTVRGLTENVQVSTHLLAWPVVVPNAFVKWRFLDRPELRASIEGGFVWAALALLGTERGEEAPLLLMTPLELRAAMPLTDSLELHVAALGRWTLAGVGSSSVAMSSLRLDVTLMRPDESGTWLLWGRFPLVTRASVRLDTLLGGSNVTGALAVDDLASWGVLVARDQRIGERVHLRFGAGYRNTYGILFYESLGHVLLHFEGYWRRAAR